MAWIHCQLLVSLEDYQVSDRKHDLGRYGFDSAPLDENFGGSWVEPYHRNRDPAAATEARPAARRDSREELGARATRHGPVQVQYLLKAWSEGHYAQVAHSQSRICPYPEGSEMARAWQQGWQFGSNQEELIG